MDAALPGDARDRRDVDDRAAARLAHCRDRVFHPEKRAGRVDPHDAFPGGGVEQILDRAAADPGIVDEDVELAIGGQRRGDRGLPFRFARHVEMLVHRGAVRLRDLRGDFLALIVEHVSNDDLGAFAREDPRHAGAHPRCRAGDQRDLVFESHDPALLLSSPRPPRPSYRQSLRAIRDRPFGRAASARG